MKRYCRLLSRERLRRETPDGALRTRPQVVRNRVFDSPYFHIRFPRNRLHCTITDVRFQMRISRTSKSMSRDARHGISFDPQRIVGFISGGCGGEDGQAARADRPGRTCNASLRAGGRAGEPRRSGGGGARAPALVRGRRAARRGPGAPQCPRPPRARPAGTRVPTPGHAP